MILTISNWNINEFLLWQVHSKQRPSIMGSCIKLLPLDYVLGDILSLTFITSQNGGIHPAKDAAWLRSIRNDLNYCTIADCAIEEEGEDTYSYTILALLHNFFSLPEGLITIDNFQWFLAAAQIPEPHPRKNIVPKGFWINGIEDHKGILARNKLLDAIGGENCSAFFDMLESVKSDVDLHCHFDIHGFADLALVSAYLILRDGKTLQRCAHCGCLFSPSRTGEIYCNRIAPGDKRQTCKEAAKYQKQLARERASESGKIYKSINTMLAAKVDYAKTPEDADKRRAELFAFRDASKRWREEIKHGTATEAEYIAFLNSFKKRKPN